MVHAAGRADVGVDLELPPRGQQLRRATARGLRYVQDPRVVQGVQPVGAAEENQLPLPRHCDVSLERMRHAVPRRVCLHDWLGPGEPHGLARGVADTDGVLALQYVERVGVAKPVAPNTTTVLKKAAEHNHHLTVGPGPDRHGHHRESADAAVGRRVARDREPLQVERRHLQVQKVQVLEFLAAAAPTAEHQDLVPSLRRLVWCGDASSQRIAPSRW